MNFEQIVNELYDPNRIGVVVIPEFIPETLRERIEKEVRTSRFNRFHKEGEGVDETVNYLIYEREGSVEEEMVKYPLERVKEMPAIAEFLDFYNKWLQELKQHVRFEIDPQANSVHVNRYTEGCHIGPHRDHSYNVNLMGILTAYGNIEFYVGKGRKNKKLISPQRIIRPPRSVVIIRAPRNESERNLRPWHQVGKTNEERATVILRQVADLESLHQT